MSSAVLLSGGLDSAVLLAEEAARGHVRPIYISVGLAWEAAERDMLDRFLAAAADCDWSERLGALACLTVDMTDVYAPGHWALNGTPPGYHTPDEDVYLAGRNIVLLGKAGVYCAVQNINRVVLGTLDHNPFPDATAAFRSAMGTALSLGLDCPLQIDAPYAHVRKAEVIRRGVALGVPLHLTLSCMKPVAASGLTVLTALTGAPQHCGVCSKCRERHDAFVEAGVADPTGYADTTYTAAQ